MALLQVDKLGKRFGTIVVADALSFEVADGEALGIIGPNGAGKTSLFNLISGDLLPDHGHILLDGREVSHLATYARCRRGIARTYQIPRPFVQLTVLENVMVGATFGRDANKNDQTERVMQSLRRTSLLAKANQSAGSLTLLELKRLELARALACNPRLLLLDEIAGGLTEHEARDMIVTIQAIRGEGVSIVWIEHVVHALISVVDRLMAINFGVKLVEGEPRRVLENRDVQQIYMGIGVE